MNSFLEKKNTISNYKLYAKYGMHYDEDKKQFYYRIYAPYAAEIYIFGTFNQWQKFECPLEKQGDEFYGEFPTINVGDEYYLQIITSTNEEQIKSDPFAFYSALRPSKASKVVKVPSNPYSSYTKRPQNLNIYEVHLVSFMKKEEIINDEYDYYSYRELAPILIKHLKKVGYNAIELMPLTEYPLDKSWGYQITGFFSATNRFGTIEDLQWFVNEFHKNDFLVFFDFVPVHFCQDSNGLVNFGGQKIFEKNYNELWGTYNFNFDSPFVRNFLISSAIYWFETFNFDGIRVDAVSNLIYSEQNYQMIKNYSGIAFAKELTTQIRNHAGSEKIIVAEDSSALWGVTKPVTAGGLGFDYKWALGWMNDTFAFFRQEFENRHTHFSMLLIYFEYMNQDRFILPFSHDEVTHGKKSNLLKMPGSIYEKFSQLKLLYALMYSTPGNKLNFMGNDIAAINEFSDHEEVEWDLLTAEEHLNFLNYFTDLVTFYKQTEELFQLDYNEQGFELIIADEQNSVLGFLRKSHTSQILILFNFSNKTLDNYLIDYPYMLQKELLFSTTTTNPIIRQNNTQIEVTLTAHSAYFVK